jgi:hypothetical protein
MAVDIIESLTPLHFIAVPRQLMFVESTGDPATLSLTPHCV